MKNYKEHVSDNDNWQWQSVGDTKLSKGNRPTSQNFFLKTQSKPHFGDVGKGKKRSEMIFPSSKNQRRVGSKQNQFRKVSLSPNQDSNHHFRMNTEANQRFMKTQKPPTFISKDEHYIQRGPLNLESPFKIFSNQSKKKSIAKKKKDAQYLEAQDQLPHFTNIKQDRSQTKQQPRSQTYQGKNMINHPIELQEQSKPSQRVKSFIQPKKKKKSTCSKKQTAPIIVKTSLNSKIQSQSSKEQMPVEQTDQEILLRLRSRFQSPDSQFNIAFILKVIVYLVVFMIIAGLFVVFIARMKSRPFCDNDSDTIKSGYPQTQNSSVFDYLLNSLKGSKKCEKCPQFANCDSGQFYCQCGYVKSGKNQCIKDAQQRRQITQFVDNLLNYLGVQKGKNQCQSKDIKYQMTSNEIQEKFRKQYSRTCNYFDKLDYLQQQIQNQVSHFKLSGDQTRIYQARYPIMSFECRSHIFLRDNFFILTIGLITLLYFLYKIRKVFRRCKFNRRAKAIFKSVQDKLRNNQKKMDQDEIYDICAEDGVDGVHVMKQIDQLMKKDKSVRRYTRMQNGQYKTFWEWSGDKK